MTDRIAAKGYTRVVLVLNMKRFIQGKEARQRFETRRGSILGFSLVGLSMALLLMALRREGLGKMWDYLFNRQRGG